MGRSIQSRIDQHVHSAERHKRTRCREDDEHASARLRRAQDYKKMKPTPRNVDAMLVEKSASALRLGESADTTKRNITNQNERKRVPPHTTSEDEAKFYAEIDAPLTDVCASCGECAPWKAMKTILYDGEDSRFQTLAGNGKFGRGLVEAGMSRDGVDEYAHVCARCNASLARRTVPRYSMASGFGIGSLPNCLTVLNPLEARMLGLGICFTTVFSLGHCGQSATRGNSISLWNESYDFVSTLPRPANRCGVVIVNVPGVNQAASYHHVRPWLLREALMWLKANNPLYRDVLVDEDLLQNMPTDPILPDVDMDPADIPQARRVSEVVMETDEPTFEESFVMTSLDDGQLEDEKIMEVLTGSQAERAYPLPPVGDPMNEFTTKHLMQACFPTLFPNGAGGFHPLEDERRDSNVKLADYCAHLMAWHDRRFVTHPTFKFFCLNLIQRRQVDGLLKRLKVRSYAPADSTSTASAVEPQSAKAPYSKHNTKEYLKELKPFFRSVRGTGLYWSNVRSDLKTMIGNPALENPWPTFFVTLSAADTIWPDFFRVCDPSLTLESASRLTSAQRRRYLNQNPDLAAKHFQRRFLAFFEHVLRGKDKPLGEIVDFFWRIEFQRRGSPHVHALLWVKNAPDILELSQTTNGIATLRDFADKFVSCLARFNASTTTDDTVDPLCLRPPPPHDRDARDQDLGLVVRRVQQHACSTSSSCHRNGKCRFGFPKPLKESTEVLRTESDGNVTIKFDHKRDNEATNNYNPALLSVWRANMDIQIVGNAYGAAEYTAAYVSKAEPDSVRFHRTIERALQKLPAGAPHASMLKRTANALLGSREVSAQEAIYILSNTLCLYGKSRTIVRVKVTRHSKRYYHLANYDTLVNAEGDASGVRVEPMENAYMQRPRTSEFDTLTYREFCESYEISRATPSTNQRLQRWALADQSGYIKNRSQKQAVRPSPYMRADETNSDFCFSQLMLYRPWRSLDELPEDDDDVMRTYERWKRDTHCIWTSKIDERIAREAVLAASRQPTLLLPAQEWRIHFDDSTGVVRPVSTTESDAFTPRRLYSRQDISRAKSFMKDVIKPFVEFGRLTTADSRARPYTYPTSDQHEAMTDDQWAPFALWMLQTRQRLRASHDRTGSQQMQMIITGEGGTGKSWLLQHILQDMRIVYASEPTAKRVLLMAHQGSAAHLIGGRTLVSALGLPAQGCKYRNAYVPFDDVAGGPATLRRLQREYEDVTLVVIDEFGVISSGMLHWIDRRLQEIFPHHSHMAFGGRDILFTGDPGQLGPINPSSLSTPDTLLVTSAEKSGRMVWTNIPLYFELKQQNRGRDDSQWYDMLRRVRAGTATSDDVQLINSRVTDSIQHSDKDQVFVAYRNRDVDTANDLCLASLQSPVLKIHAHHDVKLRTTNIEPLDEIALAQLHEQAKSLATARTNHLAVELNLAIGARVVLTNNIEQQAGLCNGSRGVVHDVMLDTDEHQPILLVAMDSYRGPSFLDDVPSVVPITCQTAPLSVDKNCKYKFSRTALPVRLGFATTIHKIQGQTCERVVFNPSAMNSSALAYVALSRVRNRSSIRLTSPITFKQLQQTERMRKVESAELARIQPLVSLSHDRARCVLPAMKLIARNHNLHVSISS